MKKLLLWLFFLSQCVHAESDIYKFSTPELESRYQILTEELRCLVCQNQNIADSHAELAQDLRHKVYEQLNSGATNEQILNYMTERYGDFVLYRPPFNVKTLILWLAPILTLFIGGIVGWSLLKHNKKEEIKLSSSESEHLNQLLHSKTPSNLK